MPESYDSAAIRHLEDATSLWNSGRIDNAGHLIGFAAECAIKHRITSLRPMSNATHGHFPELLVAARRQLGPRSRYTPIYDVLKGDVFKDWHVNRRYEETGHTSETELTSWFALMNT